MTPLPWKVRTLGDDCFVEGNEVCGETIAGAYRREVLSDDQYPEKLSDAQFVVRAVNAHEALVATVRSLNATVSNCTEQIAQMKGMFDDEDGTIEEALDNAEETTDASYTLLKTLT